MGGGQGLRTVAYYTDWSTYARSHQPYDLPAPNLTHVLFAFANILPQTGEVILVDKWADTDKRYTDHGDTWNDAPGAQNVYGCVKQLFLLKKANRHMKVLLSIGGWTWSGNFAPMASTALGRQAFARSAVKIIEDVGFDGIDIDWEYPKGGEQASHFVELLREVRAELNRAEATRQYGRRPHFLLTIACSAGPQHYNEINPRAMDPYLDFWNVMAYDYSGSWDATSGHQANLYPSMANPESTPFNTDQALRYYTSHGVRADKLVLGMPLYGRAFQQTKGPGTPYAGVGEGSWENGIWDYKKLPLEGCTEYVDREAVASWCFNPATGLMVSYDNAEVAQIKAEFIRKYGFGGAMWWESSADRPMGQGSLIETVIGGCGGFGRLETSSNCLEYPNSQYDNIKQGMPS